MRAVSLCLILAACGCRLDARFQGGGDGGAAADMPVQTSQDLAMQDLSGPPPGVFDVTPLSTMVKEHEAFTLRLTAKDTKGAVLTGYNGSVTLSSDWGDLEVLATPTFTNGVAEFGVSLNRETNVSQLAHIRAADGAMTGQSSGMTVVAPAWVQDDALASPLIKPSRSAATNWDYVLPNDPTSLVFTGSGFIFYYAGWTSTSESSIGRATSPDFTNSWSFYPASTAQPNPILKKSASGWDASGVGSPAVVYDGSAFAMIYSGSNGSTYGLGLATSTDGVAWAKYASNPVISSAVAGCPNITSQRLIVEQPGTYRIFARGTDTSGNGFGCTATSSDSGKSWSAMTKLAGLDAGGAKLNFITAVVKEKSVYKMWFTVSPFAQNYATSSDGVNWVLSPSSPLAVNPYAAVWDTTRHLFDGMIECYDNATHLDNWCRGHRP